MDIFDWHVFAVAIVVYVCGYTTFAKSNSIPKIELPFFFCLVLINIHHLYWIKILSFALISQFKFSENFVTLKSKYKSQSIIFFTYDLIDKGLKKLFFFFAVVLIRNMSFVLLHSSSIYRIYCDWIRKYIDELVIEFFFVEIIDAKKKIKRTRSFFFRFYRF